MTQRALVIGGYHTAQDGLFTMAKLQLETPPIVENYIDVDGMHGNLDFSEAPAGSPVYRTRKLTAIFETSRGRVTEREERISEFIRRVHGKRLQILHPDYPGRYLMGRIQLQRDFNNLAYGQVSLSAVCDPWLYAMHDDFLELPVLDRSHNLVTYDAVTTMDELSTCETSLIGDTEVVTVTLVTKPGSAHSYGVFRLAAAPNTNYYISGRLSGKGYWRAGTTTEMPEVFSPIVTSDENGYFYIFVCRLQAAGIVNLNDVLCLSVGDVHILSTGDAPGELSCTRPEGVATILSVNGQSYVHNSYFTPEPVLPVGDSLAVAFRHSTTEEACVEAIQWKRRWI